MAPLSFIIVGSGYRALHFARVARQYPQSFRMKYLLCRTEEKAERIRRDYGIPTTASREVCLAAEPDFAVVAVDRGSVFPVTREWLGRGLPVLAETSAAVEVEQLEELWALRQRGARVMVAEQYIRYPLVAAGLRALRQGLLGDPYAVALSLAHDYHGASLIRHMLNLGLDMHPGGLPAVRVFGKAYTFPVEETDSRYGPITDGSVQQRTRSVMTLEFEGGKTAFYDFDPVQYRSFIRSRHINMRGIRGEWNDTVLRYTDDTHHPVRRELRIWLDPAYERFQTEELRRMRETWQPEVHMEQAQDDYATATLLWDMGDLIAAGREGYPLAEALEDAYLWFLMEEAAAKPGTVLSSQPHSWQRGRL